MAFLVGGTGWAKVLARRRDCLGLRLQSPGSLPGPFPGRRAARLALPRLGRRIRPNAVPHHMQKPLHAMVAWRGRTPSRGRASARYENCAVAGWAAGGQRKDAEETLCANGHRNGAAHSAGHVHRHSTHSHGAGRGLQRLPPLGASNGLVLARPVLYGMCASRNRLGGRYNRFARSCQAIGAGGGRAAGRARLCGNA